MFFQNWKREIRSIPNLLSLSRLFLIPVYLPLYLFGTTPAAQALARNLFALSCITDFLDGWIARRYQMVTNLGKFLDPLADKVTQLAVTACLSIRYPELFPVLLMLAFKEFFQAMMGWVYFRQNKVLPGALLAGKASTAVLFVSLGLLVFLPRMADIVVKAVVPANLIFLTGSFLEYAFAYLGNPGKLMNLKKE